MIKNIEDLYDITNIADKLDQEELDKIGADVLTDYQIDEDSREDWKKNNKEAMKLAMQIEEVKNTPYKNSANVKYPAIATASIQFSARALPALIKDREVVKVRTTGKDKDGSKQARADRVSAHMSYQLVTEQEEWLGSNDQLLTTLPVLGCMFKKSYYSDEKRRNVSEVIFPEDCVMHYKTKDMDSATRITHILNLFPNKIISKKRSGIFLNIEYSMTYDPGPDEDVDESSATYYRDTDAPQKFLEMHKWLDLDEDGYKEPYIVTIQKSSGKVARIVSRWESDGIERNDENEIKHIEPIQYFTRFPFLLSPDGSIYALGFGALLRPLNKTINQTVNMLLDSGALSNQQGGFLAKGLQFGRGKGGGRVHFEMGEWKHLNIPGDDISKSIFQLPTKEPSMVLFQLLGLMIKSTEKLSSVADVMTGESPGGDVPATTTLALIEQGMKVFGAIYGRVHRSFKSEYRKLYKLNSNYLPDIEYFKVLDDQKAIQKSDYENKKVDIDPVSDPTEVTEMQKYMKADLIKSLKGQGYDDEEINLMYLEILNIPDKDRLIMTAEKKAKIKPPVDPKIQVQQMKMQSDQMKLQAEQQEKQRSFQLEMNKHNLDRSKFEFDMMVKRADVLEKTTKAILNIAKAEAEEPGQQLDQYKAELSQYKMELDMMTKTEDRMVKERGSNDTGQ